MTAARPRWPRGATDWPESTEPILTVLPRGLAHDGVKAGAEDLHDPNPGKRTSKYGPTPSTSPAT